MLSVGKLYHYTCGKFLLLFPTTHDAVDEFHRAKRTFPKAREPGTLDPQEFILDGREPEKIAEVILEYWRDTRKCPRIRFVSPNDFLIPLECQFIDNVCLVKFLLGEHVGWATLEDWIFGFFEPVRNRNDLS